MKLSLIHILPSATDFEELPLEDGSTYYQGASDGTTAGYVFTTESKGYGGTIQVLTGIDNDGNVTGVAILSHNETPGPVSYTHLIPLPVPKA